MREKERDERERERGEREKESERNNKSGWSFFFNSIERAGNNQEFCDFLFHSDNNTKNIKMTMRGFLFLKTGGENKNAEKGGKNSKEFYFLFKLFSLFPLLLSHSNAVLLGQHCLRPWQRHLLASGA